MLMNAEVLGSSEVTCPPHKVKVSSGAHFVGYLDSTVIYGH